MSGLPRGWASANLSELAGKIVDGSHSPPPKAETGYPMLSARNIQDERIIFDEYRLVAPVAFAAEHRRTRICHGDVLLTIVGAIGRTAVVSDEKQFVLQRSVAVIGVLKGVEPHFLSKAFLNPAFQQWLNDNAKGTAQKGIYLNTLASAQIAIPPLPEQRRIVAKIDGLSAKSKRSRDHLDQVPRLVDKYKKSILTAAFRGDLVGSQSSAEFRNVPFSDVIASTFYGPRIASDAYVKSGIPTLRTTDIGDWGQLVLQDPPQVRVNDAEFVKWGLADQDLLVTRTGATIGKCTIYSKNIGPALPSAYLIRVRLKLHLINAKFALLYMLSPEGENQLLAGRTAVAQPNINARAISAISIPLPTIERQQAIVSAIENSFAWIDRLAKEAESARKLIDHLDQAVLVKAFQGELVAPDPSDEPASALLERVRSERQFAYKAIGLKNRPHASGSATSPKSLGRRAERHP